MYLPGDGRVMRASVMGENMIGRNNQSLYQGPLPFTHAFFACGGHGSLHNDQVLHDNALSMLVHTAVR